MSPAQILYHKYLTLAAEVNHPPVCFAEWLALCEWLVPVSSPRGFPIPWTPIDTGMATRRKPRRPGEDEQLVDARNSQLFVGELRLDGGVSPVRRQTLAISEKYPLNARVCRGPCKQFLPISRFSKQGKGHRSICKTCDNARRTRKTA